MTTNALDFAELARHIVQALAGSDLVVPTFASPPKDPDVDRSIKRRNGSPLVSVRIRARSMADVATDMIEGVVVANNLLDDQATQVRSVLCEALQDVISRNASDNTSSDTDSVKLAA